MMGSGELLLEQALDRTERGWPEHDAAQNKERRTDRAREQDPGDAGNNQQGADLAGDRAFRAIWWTSLTGTRDVLASRTPTTGVPLTFDESKFASSDTFRQTPAGSAQWRTLVHRQQHRDGTLQSLAHRARPRKRRVSEPRW